MVGNHGAMGEAFLRLAGCRSVPRQATPRIDRHFFRAVAAVTDMGTGICALLLALASSGKRPLPRHFFFKKMFYALIKRRQRNFLFYIVIYVLDE